MVEHYDSTTEEQQEMEYAKNIENLVDNHPRSKVRRYVNGVLISCAIAGGLAYGSTFVYRRCMGEPVGIVEVVGAGAFVGGLFGTIANELVHISLLRKKYEKERPFKRAKIVGNSRDVEIYKKRMELDEEEYGEWSGAARITGLLAGTIGVPSLYRLIQSYQTGEVGESASGAFCLLSFALAITAYVYKKSANEYKRSYRENKGKLEESLGVISPKSN